MAKVEPFQSSFDAKLMMRHAFPWQHQRWHEWNVAWMENPALNYNSAVSKDYGNVSLAYFYSWLLTSSIVCLILSKIIPSISTTAFTAHRVTGLLEPIEPINNEDTGRTCKGHTERPWVSKKKSKVTEWTTALPCHPWQSSNYFTFLSLFAHFLRSSIIGEKRVLVKERNSKTKEITLRETMQ